MCFGRLHGRSSERMVLPDRYLVLQKAADLLDREDPAHHVMVANA